MPNEKKIPFKTGGEHDALSRVSKKCYKWRSGVRKLIKRQYNKRMRRTANQKIDMENNNE